MASLDRTAYPRLGKRFSDEELCACYELSGEEQDFVRRNAHKDNGRLTLAIMLKTRQQLGYFPDLAEVPDQIRTHLAKQLEVVIDTALIGEAHHRPTLHRYRSTIRAWLGSTAFSDAGRDRAADCVRQAAQTMSDPADLINVVVEELTKANIELPAFSTLDRLVGHERQEVHDALYLKITHALNPGQCPALDALLEVSEGEKLTGFARLKETPGPATLSHFREWAERLAKLNAVLDPRPFLDGVAYTKIRQFAAEASAYEISDMRGIRNGAKRYTLLLSLLHQTQSNTRDELIDMFLRRMRRTQSAAQEHLHTLQDKHREMEESLIGVLGKVLHHAKEGDTDEGLGRQIRQMLAEQGGIEALDARYEVVTAYHQNNYRPLLWPAHTKNRAVLFRVLDLLQIKSATQDHCLLDALDFVRQHRNARKNHLPFEIDLSFASQRWQDFVQGDEKGEQVLDRRALEVCVFTYLAEALQSGDLYVMGSGAYADYRTQLLPWSECQKRLADYCHALKLPTSGRELIASLREQLTRTAAQVDASFPDNSELTIDEDGMPHLKKQKASSPPEGLLAFEEAVHSRMPERHLLDILKNVHHWARYTRHFGPPSGSDPKLSDATQRYLFAVFGFGCNLGASQTARHAPETVNRQTLRRINAQHINVAKLEAALNDIIGEYARLELPRLWGKGKVAIADGTHVELRKNNLLGERHIRYGGYGSIAYHHISDTYIALFSNFIACGVWEAVYILDALMQNTSAFQPDTLHADTHGQSEPVFALAHLLGIKLFPRMRNWNDAVFYRPEKSVKYKHIDALFTKTVDWKLIETHWQDMMQVVLSIQAGKVLPSMLLRKLGSHNRKNKLYRAFRELGRVVRTLFLLRYISEADLRQSIRAETTKIESYNDFLDWIAFGGQIIKSGDPVEQAKQIKYMNLVFRHVLFFWYKGLLILTNFDSHGRGAYGQEVYDKTHARRAEAVGSDSQRAPGQTGDCRVEGHARQSIAQGRSR